MRRMIYLFYAVLVVITATCSGEDGKPFQRIDRRQTFCELNSITTATKLSDHFNSMDEHVKKNERMNLEFIAEHLGFGWEHYFHGNAQQVEVSPNAQSVAAQKKGGWVNENGIAPSYSYLGNKWIYFYGDHTLRQLTHAYLFPAHGKSSFHEAECVVQKARSKIGEETGASAHSDSYLPQHSKAKTCEFPGYGTNGKITYDWKHAPYDDYDEWLFGETGIWGSDLPEGQQVPDVLVIQVGYSTCLPSADPNLEETQLQHSESLFEEHKVQINTLFSAIKQALSRSTSSATPGKKTTVIISTAPRSRVRNVQAEHCTYKMNRIVALAAHMQGFPVFEREEMEHRINFKSETSDDLLPLGVLDDAPPPTAQILATSLLSMLKCLTSDVVEPPSV